MTEPTTLWGLLDAFAAAEAREPGRFSLEGPFNFGDPVHETLTQRSLSEAGLIDWAWEREDPRVWEYLRGVIWNDDPEGLLFDEDPKRTNNFSSGLAFATAFKRAERETKVLFHGPKARLLARSHFGDLQFFHAMASRDGEDPLETKKWLLSWCELTFAAATRRIDASQRLGSFANDGVAKLFGAELTLGQLFGLGSLGVMHRRALGSLLHIIQDSYASGHVERELNADGSKGAVCCFYAYAGQDHHLHAADDGWRSGGTEDERIKSVKGATDAIRRGAQLAKFVADAAPWPVVREFLHDDVFQLAAGVRPSGPGTAYTPKAGR